VGREFASHGRVPAHRFRNVRGDITTNMVEGYFSIFKRGMKCVCQHCSEKHLHRYLAEFGFRYSHRVALGYSDEMRGAVALSGIRGKRLTHRRPDSAAVTAFPGQFVLALTYESIKIPKHLIALVEGRSTYARLGLSMHQTAPWIQPGWSGPI